MKPILANFSNLFQRSTRTSDFEKWMSRSLSTTIAMMTIDDDYQHLQMSLLRILALTPNAFVILAFKMCYLKNLFWLILSLFSGSLHTYRLAHLPSTSHRTSLPHPLLHVVSPKAPFLALFCSIYTQPHLVLSLALPPSLIYYTRMIHSFLSHLLPKTFLLSSQIYSQPFHLFHPGCHQIA